VPCIILVVSAVWGSVVVFGTYRRWSLFVDPPSGLWRALYNFQYARKRYGEKFVIGYLYLIGIILTVFGLAGLLFLPWCACWSFPSVRFQNSPLPT